MTSFLLFCLLIIHAAGYISVTFLKILFTFVVLIISTYLCQYFLSLPRLFNFFTKPIDISELLLYYIARKDEVSPMY